MNGKGKKILSRPKRTLRRPASSYRAAGRKGTRQKKGEDEFLRLSEFNKAIIGNAPVAIFTLDRNGVFTSVNPALGALSGLGPKAGKKLIGFNWLKNPYTIKSGLAAYIERGLQGEPFQLWDFPFIAYAGDRNVFLELQGRPPEGKRRRDRGSPLHYRRDDGPGGDEGAPHAGGAQVRRREAGCGNRP